MKKTFSVILRVVRVSALALVFSPGAYAADDCKPLNGTYQYQSVAPREGMPEYLSNFTVGKEKAKLFQRDGGKGPGSLAPGGTIARPKITHLATVAAFSTDATGTRVRFIDAQGKDIVTLGIDSPRWRCKGGKLERSQQRSSGLGDVMRTEKVEESFARDAATGDLVYTETVTTVDPPGGKPKKSEARFKLARATT